MPLLSDGNPNTTTDLQAYESGILDLAAREAIDLEVKLGLATEEISEEVLNVLLDHARTYDPQSTARRTIGVSDVVVSAPMKRWHALHTLKMVYRDAFNNQLNDRYLPKVNEYGKLEQQAREHTWKLGIGLVLAPIPQAGTPALTATPLAGATANTYYVAVSWVGSTGQEGAPSQTTTFDAPAGSILLVQALNPPASADAFNVYCGLSPTTLALQNGLPVPVGQSFAVGATGLAAGRATASGQSADTYIISGPTLRRG